MINETPPAGGRKKYVSRSQIRRITEGGRKADALRDERELRHRIEEEPLAENQMRTALDNWPQKSNPDRLIAAEPPQKPIRSSFWSKLFPFITKK